MPKTKIAPAEIEMLTATEVDTRLANKADFDAETVKLLEQQKALLAVGPSPDYSGYKDATKVQNPEVTQTIGRVTEVAVTDYGTRFVMETASGAAVTATMPKVYADKLDNDAKPQVGDVISLSQEHTIENVTTFSDAKGNLKHHANTATRFRAYNRITESTFDELKTEQKELRTIEAQTAQKVAIATASRQEDTSAAVAKYKAMGFSFQEIAALVSAANGGNVNFGTQE